MKSNDLTIEIQHKKIKNIYIRIRRDKTVLVTAPLFCTQDFIEDFIAKKEPWIRKNLAKMSDIPTYHYTTGEMHYYLGRPVTLGLLLGERNGGLVRGDKVYLVLYSPKTNRKKLYENVMKEYLRQVIIDMLEVWVPKMKVLPGGIVVKKMKSRWGTCNTRTGELCFALDLVTKPKSCIEEVLVHEMNHLLEKGHTPRFHALMAQWMPDYKEREKVLNEWPKEFV